MKTNTQKFVFLDEAVPGEFWLLEKNQQLNDLENRVGTYITKNTLVFTLLDKRDGQDFPWIYVVSESGELMIVSKLYIVGKRVKHKT